jgi:hypothetical protein
MHKFRGSNSLHFKSLRLTVLQVYVVLSLKSQIEREMEFRAKEALPLKICSVSNTPPQTHALKFHICAEKRPQIFFVFGA